MPFILKNILQLSPWVVSTDDLYFRKIVNNVLTQLLFNFTNGLTCFRFRLWIVRIDSLLEEALQEKVEEGVRSLDLSSH